MLFGALQSANLPLDSNSYTQTIAMPVVHATAAYTATDESHVPPVELIDRWEPYIKEASARFSIPEKWIRTIIRIESGGRNTQLGRPIVSNAGAMGVMQLEGGTYKEISARNGLGSDPYNVRDNILAGTAYLRELYNRFGYPQLFEAYNAGPGVCEKHIMHGVSLPAETTNYVREAVMETGSPAAAQKALGEALDPGTKTKLAAASQVHVAAKHVQLVMQLTTPVRRRVA